MTSYLETVVWIADNDQTADVTTATGDISSFGIFNVVERLMLFRIGALIKTAIDNTSVEAIITIDRRILTDSDTGRVEPVVTGATLTMADNTTVGKIIYKNITRTELSVGDQLVAEVTTAGTGGGPAGAYLPVYWFYRTDYTAAKESDFTASA